MELNKVWSCLIQKIIRLETWINWNGTKIGIGRREERVNVNWFYCQIFIKQKWGVWLGNVREITQILAIKQEVKV